MEKILIADDEQLMRQLVIDFLKPEGYEIVEAADGKEALEKCLDTTGGRSAGKSAGNRLYLL